MVELPVPKPADTTPDSGSIAATVALLLVQKPPSVVSTSVVVVPVHKLVAPVMAEGDGITVKEIVALQPGAGE